jgi:hypothetical protein
MELTGDLSDFALADILQIMALSRKTGTILLESGEHKGRIVLKQGKITHASTSSVESLAERIIRTKGIRGEFLQELLNIGSKSSGVWAFNTLVIESGILADKDLKAEVSSHIRSVLGSLIALHKGRFNIVLNNAVIPESYKEVVLLNGLEVSEVLIEAARYSDELKRVGNRFENQLEDLQEEITGEDNNDLYFDDSESDNVSLSDSELFDSDHNKELDKGLEKSCYSKRLARFCSLLGELNANTSSSEITLMLMRYASELVSRGILFSVGKAELCGLGQFGLSTLGGIGGGNNSDIFVRNMRIPLSSRCLLGSIVKTPRPIIEKMQESYLHEEMINKIGGVDRDLTLFAVPLVCDGRVIFVLYGDNFPGQDPIDGVEELFVFAHLAGLVLEKIKLEERILSLKV